MQGEMHNDIKQDIGMNSFIILVFVCLSTG